MLQNHIAIFVSLIICSVALQGMGNTGSKPSPKRLKHYAVMEIDERIRQPQTAFTGSSTSSISPAITVAIPAKPPIQKNIISAHQKSVLLPNPKKQFPLHWAAATGDIEMLKKELQHRDPNELDSNRRSAFHYAAANGNFEIAKLMCQHLKQQNKLPRFSTDSSYQTPIEYARKQGRQDIISVLSPRTENVPGAIQEATDTTTIAVQPASTHQQQIEFTNLQNTMLIVTDASQHYVQTIHNTEPAKKTYSRKTICAILSSVALGAILSIALPIAHYYGKI
jgi:ankyrin repeat protein